MLRVTKKEGSLVIITNGTEDKRMPDFLKFSSSCGAEVDIVSEKIELSKLS